jgi:hypothetical protein
VKGLSSRIPHARESRDAGHRTGRRGSGGHMQQGKRARCGRRLDR